MQIKKIYSMKWSEDNSYVILIADTDTGDNEEIATPYSEESIIWDAVKTFPVNEIQPPQSEELQ